MRHFLVALVIAIEFGSLSSFECGVRKVNLNPVIVSGQSTFPGEWPWHVAIYRRTGVSDSYACGGTIISAFYVLTADHCVKGDNGFVLSTRRLFVRAGIHNLQEPDWKTTQQHGVAQIHEFGDSTNFKNDIALLELSTKVRFTNYVQPACVSQVEDLTKQCGTAVGWGVTEHDVDSPVLKSSSMPVVSTLECLESNDGEFRLVLDSSNFCAGYLNGTTVCNGDSGGGLHFERNGVWYVGGIVSFTAPRASGNKCHTKSYAGFTNVYRFIPWIRSVTGLQYLNQNSTVQMTHQTRSQGVGYGNEGLGSFMRKQPIPNQTPGYAPHSNDFPEDCGRYLVNRITRGSTAKVDEFPWMAELFVKSKTRVLSSGYGSLIHKRYVLTTVYLYSLSFVRLGQHNCSEIAPQSVQEIDIGSITCHPKYNKTTGQNDIGLVRLAKDAIFTDHVQPICLPTTRVEVPQYIVSGWGRTSGGNVSEILQKAIVPAISLSECETEHRKTGSRLYIGEGLMCAGWKGTPNTCSFDQGTALGYPHRYPDKSVRFVQYGITLIAFCSNRPSIYIDVVYHMDWIRETVAP